MITARPHHHRFAARARPRRDQAATFAVIYVVGDGPLTELVVAAARDAHRTIEAQEGRQWCVPRARDPFPVPRSFTLTRDGRGRGECAAPPSAELRRAPSFATHATHHHTRHTVAGRAISTLTPPLPARHRHTTARTPADVRVTKVVQKSQRSPC